MPETTKFFVLVVDPDGTIVVNLLQSHPSDAAVVKVKTATAETLAEVVKALAA